MIAGRKSDSANGDFFLIVHFAVKGHMNDSVRFQFRVTKIVAFWSSIDGSDSLLPIITKYRSGMVNSNTVNSKFYLIRSYCEICFYDFPNIPCLKCTVNSNFHLIRSKTLLTNDFELTVPDLYSFLNNEWVWFSVCVYVWSAELASDGYLHVLLYPHVSFQSTYCSHDATPLKDPDKSPFLLRLNGRLTISDKYYLLNHIIMHRQKSLNLQQVKIPVYHV